MGKLLHQAVKNQNLQEVVKQLKSNDVDEKDEYSQQTALHLACSGGNREIVKKLLQKKAHVNTQDRNGWTAFHFAASEGHIAVFHLLLQQNDVDVGILTKDGTSALHYLVRFKPNTEEDKTKFEESLKLYVEKNGDINSQSKHGESALHQAAARGNNTSVLNLLNQKAKIDILNKIGETPLQYAVRSEQKETIKLLLDHRASADIKLPSDIAVNPEITALLSKSELVHTKSGNVEINPSGGAPAKDMGEYKLRVKIVRATNLTPVGEKDTASSYCQVVFNKQRHNTKVVPKNLNPKWGEVFLFDVEDLNYPLKATLYEQRDDGGQPTKDDLLGSITLSLPFMEIDTSGAGNPLSDWYLLKRKPRRAGYKQSPKVRVEVSYILKSNLKDSQFQSSLNLASDSDLTNSGNLPCSDDSDPSSGVFGIRRGKCKQSECDCDGYQPESARGGPCQNCGHWPAQHQNLGGNASGGKDSSSASLSVPHKAEGSSGDVSGNAEEGTSVTDIANQFAGHSGGILTYGWEIDPDDLTFVERLGEGAFAQVYKGEYRSQEVAIKVLKDKPEANGLIDFKKEFDILSMLRSPHLVFFYGATTQPSLSLVFEFCHKGTLHDVLNNLEEEIGWSRVFGVALDAIKGLLCLHKWKPEIVHRDMKSLNLLVSNNWVCKVSDFGTSRATAGTTQDLATLGKLRGTYAYCAPEVYYGKTFTTKSDIFSFGVILWELAYRCLTGKYEQPFAEYKNIQFDFQILIQSAKKDLRPTIPEKCPAPFASLISRCWDKDPDVRPTTEEVSKSLRDLEQVYVSNKSAWDSVRVHNPGS